MKIANKRALAAALLALVLLVQLPVAAIAAAQPPQGDEIEQPFVLEGSGEEQPENREDGAVDEGEAMPEGEDRDLQLPEPPEPDLEPEPEPEPRPEPLPEPEPQPAPEGETPPELPEVQEQELEPAGPGGRAAMAASLPIVGYSVIAGSPTIASLFPDAVFAAYIAGLLPGKTVNSTVTQNELNTITLVNPSGAVHSVEGIQYLNGLREVRLDNLQLTQRFPQAFISDIYPNVNFYIANNQRFYHDTIYINNFSLQQVYDIVPPLFFQIVENSGGAVVGTWVIMDQFGGTIDQFDAVNGRELLDDPALREGSHIIELRLNGNVWMGLNDSIYYFPIVIAAPTNGAITGTVTDENGQALAGVSISLSDGQTTTTDANGRYSFPDVAPGDNYTVTAAFNGYNSQRKTANVAASQTTIINFTLVRDIGSLHGVVEDSISTEPIPGATVQLYRSENGRWVYAGTTTTGADGSFLFAGLPAGSYRATGSAPSYSTESVYPPVGGNTTTEATIFLVPALYTLSGVVYDEETLASIAGAAVSVPGHGTVYTDGNGQYRIENLRPGYYSVTATAGGYGSETVANVDVTGGNARQDIPLLLSDGAVLVRVVRYVAGEDPIDYPPVQGATLTLSNGNVATTDDNGQYAYTLRPGAYTVAASLTGYTAVPNPATFNIIAGVATDDVVITLYPITARVWGYVYEEGTTISVENAEVRLSGVDAPYVTGADGLYEFLNASYGSLTVSAEATGYGTDQKTVQVLTSAEVRQDLELSPNPAPLNIQVRYYDTGVPVPGAEIVLSGGRSATADENGDYTFILTPGQYSAIVSAEDYTTPSQTITLLPGAAETLLFEIHLPPALVGIVQDMYTRLPVAGATVEISPVPAGDTGTRTTNASGFYAFSPIVPGEYTITVTADGYQSVTRTAVGVEPDEIITANFFLIPLLGSLTGTVTYADGTPVPGVEIVLDNGDIAITDEEGHYTFLLTAGSYKVEELADGQVKPAMIDEMTTTVVDFVLPLLPGSIYGTVADTAGRPLAGATITVYSATGQVYTATTAADGSYSVGPLPPGSYTVVAGLEGYGTEAQQVTVEPGTDTRADFVLESNPGLLEGTVTNSVTGQPIPGAVIEIGPDGILVVTDENGHYRIPLVAGSYTVTARVDGYDSQTAAADVVANQTTVRNFVFGQTTGGGGEGGGETGGVGSGAVATGDSAALPQWQLTALLSTLLLACVLWLHRRKVSVAE